MLVEVFSALMVEHQSPPAVLAAPIYVYVVSAPFVASTVNEQNYLFVPFVFSCLALFDYSVHCVCVYTHSVHTSEKSPPVFSTHLWITVLIFCLISATGSNNMSEWYMDM